MKVGIWPMELRERVARVVLIVLGLVVALSGFLRWNYDNFFLRRWETGIELDFVPAVMVFGACSAAAALKRWYLWASVFAIAGGFISMWLVAFIAGGLFGTEPRPQDVGIGASIAFYGNALIIIGGILARVFKGKRPIDLVPSTGTISVTLSNLP